MDKKNTVFGVALLLAAFALMYYGAKTTPRPPPSPDIAKPTAIANAFGRNQATGPATSALPVSSPGDATLSSLNETDHAAKVISLSNDFIDVHFVDFGGAIESVALRKYPAHKDQPEPFVFNRIHTDPMLAFTPESFPGLDRSVRYAVVSQTDQEVVFRTVFDHRIEVTRRYVLQPSNVSRKEGDPYQVFHETTFRNLTDQPTLLPSAQIFLELGTVAPVAANDYVYISSGYNDGKDVNYIQRTKLEGGGFTSFIGLGSHDPTQMMPSTGPVLWATVQDQFFASILTPLTPGRDMITRRLEFPPLPGSQRAAMGLSAAAGFEIPSALAPKSESKISMNFYVGPKEYHRLSNTDVFKLDQDKAIRFGKYIGIFSRILLMTMTKVHGWVGNWGWAIVITTLFLKTIFLPLTLASSRSAKRMQTVQPQLKALKEKYKDNPQKLNQATIALFKEHSVNPAGGCLPILITIPFFFGFYDMLRNTSELRFAEFLWAKDLSASDTVAHVFGLPLNILPLILAVVMAMQMRFTPQPTVDNQQARLMKWMPIGMSLIYYNLSCALSLYSTVNGLFTIGQQLVINRLKDTPPPAKPAANVPGRPMKNVTPNGRKKK